MMYGCHSMVDRIESVIIKHPRHAFISEDNLKKQWRKFNYAGCPDYKKALLEFEHFESVLKQYIPEIYYLPRHAKCGLDSIYTHDPLKITRKGAILMNMGKDLRSDEPAALQQWLLEIGIPVLGKIKTPGRMEGGDVIWLDQKTLAIGRGYRTNAEGIRQLKALTAGFIDRVIEVPLPHVGGVNECLHLMSLISLIDRDLAVVYSRFLPVFFREILTEMGIGLIEVADDEYDTLGTNVLALGPRKCLYLDGNWKTRRKMIRAGVEVVTYRGEEISLKGTGGPTCLTCPVSRQ